MAQSYEWVVWRFDPGNPPAYGTFMVPQTIIVHDADGDGRLSIDSSDLIDGVPFYAIWVDDTMTVQTFQGVQTITGTTFYLDAEPYAVFIPTDGTALGQASFISSTWVLESRDFHILPGGGVPVPCFTAGTLIATPEGERPVEDLRPGDMVLTSDHGPQVLRWVGSREVVGRGPLAPVRFAPGALGNTRALMVSPQHRMVISGWQAELYFGTDEVLAAALHLVNGDTICRVEMPQVRYIHLLFDRHEIVFAEGAPTESFHPGARVMAGDAALREEVLAIFPELARADRVWPAARQVVRGREAATLRMA